MKRRFWLWITSLKAGGSEIIIHEVTTRDGKVTGFVNHRWNIEERLDPR